MEGLPNTLLPAYLNFDVCNKDEIKNKLRVGKKILVVGM